METETMFKSLILLLFLIIVISIGIICWNIYTDNNYCKEMGFESYEENNGFHYCLDSVGNYHLVSRVDGGFKESTILFNGEMKNEWKGNKGYC